MSFSVLLILVSACVMKTSEEDILRQVFRCQNDGQCADGWECRGFALDPTDSRYCVRPCELDEECFDDELCGNEGFCVEACDLADPQCRHEPFHCMRMNYTEGEDRGYCQPVEPCNSSAQCPQVQNRCVPDLLAVELDSISMSLGDGSCVQECPGGACAEGTRCTTGVAAGRPEFQDLPPVCVPNCGVDNVCANGTRCLIDALRQLYPGETLNEARFRFCVPGLPTIEMPCTSDLDCLVGRCVRHPERRLPDDSLLFLCVLPCSSVADCVDNSFQCRSSQYLGQSADFCFRP